MCIYSMMADWGRNNLPAFPDWQKTITTPFTTPYGPLLGPPPEDHRVAQMYRDYLDLMKRVKEVEDKLGTCPCPDETKDAWVKEAERKLEGWEF